MSKQQVLYLDDDDDLRLAVSDVLGGLDRDCLGLASYPALLAHGEEALHCSLAILDISLGTADATGLEAYRWLRGHGFRGRIMFLTGHAQSHPLVQQARGLGDVQVFAKPINLEAFQSEILREDGA
jgi:CheY-like chemotaxis protein